MNKNVTRITLCCIFSIVSLSLMACKSEKAKTEEPKIIGEQEDIKEPDIIEMSVNQEKTESMEETENAGDREEIETLIASLDDFQSCYASYQNLYELRSACESDWDVEGSWNRTNIHSSFFGKIDITKADEKGFYYNAELYYYSHCGEIEGQAYYVTGNCAIAEFESFSEQKQYIIFIREGNEMIVKASASSGELGFGMNVFIGGEYTKEEPVYTNANILEETFSAIELEKLQDIIPESYYNDYFIFATTCGVVDVTVSENERLIEAFVPTVGGFGYKIHITDNGECSIEFDDGSIFQTEK